MNNKVNIRGLKKEIYKYSQMYDKGEHRNTEDLRFIAHEFYVSDNELNPEIFTNIFIDKVRQLIHSDIEEDRISINKNQVNISIYELNNKGKSTVILEEDIEPTHVKNGMLNTCIYSLEISINDIVMNNRDLMRIFINLSLNS